MLAVVGNENYLSVKITILYLQLQIKRSASHLLYITLFSLVLRRLNMHAFETLMIVQNFSMRSDEIQ